VRPQRRYPRAWLYEACDHAGAQTPYFFNVWKYPMGIKHCAACGQSFRPRPQAPNQSYCSAHACQRERRRRWQRAKLQSDPDYRDNQSSAQRAWLDRNPDYWREYREAHPDYVERNRNRQRTRRTLTKTIPVAKMDVSMPLQALPSGVYCLQRVVAPGVAKMDAWIVEITVVSAARPCAETACKETT
jgi:hypothetical protein